MHCPWHSQFRGSQSWGSVRAFSAFLSEALLGLFCKHFFRISLSLIKARNCRNPEDWKHWKKKMANAEKSAKSPSLLWMSWLIKFWRLCFQVLVLIFWYKIEIFFISFLSDMHLGDFLCACNIAGLRERSFSISNLNLQKIWQFFPFFCGNISDFKWHISTMPDKDWQYKPFGDN